MKNFFLYCSVFLTTGVFAQLSYPPGKPVLSEVYTQIIAEYIKDVVTIDTLQYDTLYIGNHEDFPDISLPGTIAGKKIVLLTYRDGDTIPQNRKKFKFINIIEWKFTETAWTYMLVTFHQDYRPQHNSNVELKYNSKKKKFELANKIRYDFSYPTRTK